MKTLLTFLLLSLFIQQDNDTKIALSILSNSSFPFECTRDINAAHEPRNGYPALVSQSTMDSIDFYYYDDLGLTQKIVMKERRLRSIYMLRKFEQPEYTLLAVRVNIKETGRSQWLITYDKQYQIVDTLVCGIYYDSRRSRGLRLCLRQWRINDKQVVQVSSVKLDNTDPQTLNTIHEGPCFKKPIEGQRTDTFYQLTDDGHFQKLREVKYKPQLYTSQYLITENLWNGTETPLDTH